MTRKIKKMLLIELEIIILVLSLFIIINSNIISVFPECLIYKHFGILCPSCGATRCVINLLQGNLYVSFLYHPIFFITIIYLIILNFVYIVNSLKKQEILKWIYPNLKKVIIFIILLLIFTVVRNII